MATHPHGDSTNCPFPTANTTPEPPRLSTASFVSTKGHAGNMLLTRSASSSAVATKPYSSGSFFSWVTGERSSSLPLLQVLLQIVTLPPPLPDHVEPVLIGQHPAASIGLYVNCGSVNETLYSFEATHLVECMAFKSTTNQSRLRVVREVEAIGCNVIASVSREQMGYTYDAIKTYVPEMVELLIDCVRKPAFLDRVINDLLLKVKAEITKPLTIPQAYS